MDLQKERKSTFFTAPNTGKKKLAACLLHNIDIAFVFQRLCHLKAQYLIEPQTFVVENIFYS